MRLRLKLAILLLPPVMLPLIGIGWLADKELRDEAYRTALDQMQDGLAFTTHEVDTLMATTRANIELLASSQPLQQYLRVAKKEQRPTVKRDSLVRLFANYRRVFSEYLEIRLLRPDGSSGVHVVSPEPRAGAGNENTLSPLKAPNNALNLSAEIRRDPNRDEYVLQVYRSLRLASKDKTSDDDQYTHSGVLGITISLNKLFRNLEKHRIGQQGRILLIGKDDHILFDTHHQAHNARLPVVLRQRVKSDIEIVRPSRYYLLNQPFLVLSKRLDFGLHAIAAYPTAELEKPLIKRKIAVLLGTLSALILYSSLVYGGLQRIILKPLKVLHRATTEIGNGNLTPSIEVSSRDELGDMARSLQQMGEAVNRRMAIEPGLRETIRKKGLQARLPTPGEPGNGPDNGF